MSRLMVPVLALALAASLFAGCGSSSSGDSAAPERLPAAEKPRCIDGRWLVEDFESPDRRIGGMNSVADENGLGTEIHPRPFVLQDEGAPGSGMHSAMIRGRLGRDEKPWSWAFLGLFFKPDHSPLDLSEFRAIEFHARGDGNTYSVSLTKKGGDDHYRHLFTAPPGWTRVRLPLTAFSQAGWGKALPRDFSDVTGIDFNVLRNDAPFELWVDDVVLTTHDAPAAGAVEEPSVAVATGSARVLFLHHSTGGGVWNGGVREWFDDYNRRNGTHYTVAQKAYPADGYPWENYPYDYWNIWVRNAGPRSFQGQATLEMLADAHDVIVWKHCFPVSSIEEDHAGPDAASDRKTLGNYKAQYHALREKMRSFPRTRFLVWTGAALLEGSTHAAEARRAKEFADWVKDVWDETGDNIFVWDFRQLETDGGLYLKREYAAGPADSHPNGAFARRVAPLFAQRVVDVIEGKAR